MEQIVGYVERITFHNPESGYAVIQIQQPGKHELTCVVGSMPTIQPGENARFYGKWVNHLIHGKQFVCEKYATEMPADIIGITKYLGSGLIKGIGKGYAKKIVEHFGTETLNIIQSDPDRLLEISGLGPKRLEKIKTCWIEQQSIREVMVFLQTYGVSPGYAQKIFKIYGQQAIQIVKENPYRLAKDIQGIGFKSADIIAQKLGIAKDSPERIDAGIEFALSTLSNDGHVCYPVKEFLKEAEKLLEVASASVEERITALKESDRIVVLNLTVEGESTPYIWLKPLYVSEMGIAREIIRLKRTPSLLRSVNAPNALEWVQKTLNIALAEKQQGAITAAVTEKVQIITGGPGTGKSTITNAILKITEKLTSNILLAAPTGRAAKRMSEITGRSAKTIHSLLEYDFKKRGFKKNRHNPLDCDLIIIDEASMIDTSLMYCLLKAIPDHARVILVGDVNQLPSVGPGNVLRDLIDAEIVPVTALNEIFRQAAGSQIITNAHKINQGIFPDTQNTSESDFFFINCENPDDIVTNILALVSQRLPKKYGFDPMKEIQVLSPMKRGIIGTVNLNIVLQQELNARDESLYRSGSKFQVGDKVMQIKNNYDKNVFNGDIGTILEIDYAEEQLIVQIDDQHIVYDFSDLDELVLAYAISIHKYQGSECPCIIIPIHTSHFMLLHRNLIYTGITRGKKLVVLVGTKRALAIAVRNDEVKKRYTGLRYALMDVKAKASRHLMYL